MTTIDINIPSGWDPLPFAEVTATALTGGRRPAHTSSGELMGRQTTTLDAYGEGSLTLPTTVGAVPDGTHYLVEVQGHEWHITVPATGTFDVGDPAIAAATIAPSTLVPGPTGDPGAIASASATTLTPGSSATVDLSGPDSARVMALGIPRGDPGPPGDERVAVEDLPAAATPDGTELVPVSQVGTTVRLSLDDLIDALGVGKDGGRFTGVVEIESQDALFSFGPVGATFGTQSGITVSDADGDNAISLYKSPGAEVWRYYAPGGYEFGSSTGAVAVGQNPVRMSERSDPAAPSANNVELFARDNGSGKTQICARFATGAVQVIATQP